MANENKNKNESDTDIKQVVVYDDSDASGEYYALDETWTEIQSYLSGKDRLGVKSKNAYKEIRLFVGLTDDAEVITLENNCKLFDRKYWIELRRKRGINKHKPLRVDKNGTIWIGENRYGTNYRVYVKC